MKKRSIKVLLSKLGLDVHSRGVFIVAKQLRDAGMEVIYIGNSMPEQIVKAAVQEDADVIGVSSLGGAHLQLGRELISEAEKEKIKDSKAYIIGGAIPPEDALKLKEMGFDDIFASGATKEEIISSINNIVEKKFKIFGGQIER
ncbi:MAG: cobalamin-dependent protein [Actinobacteria bacterium]|nr:cobalamin-dependent protein [Actinomycetota bacterium]MCG2789756.1 cobalamin-dependent protein [Actinomycetes bacterium]